MGDVAWTNLLIYSYDTVTIIIAMSGLVAWNEGCDISKYSITQVAMDVVRGKS